MSQIEELQSRITAAMDRIGAGVETLVDQMGSNADADAALQSALEEEKLANAQLEERLKSIKAKHAAELEAAQSAEPVADGPDVDALQDELDGLKAQVADTSEIDGLKAELAEATAKLVAAEAAKAEANAAAADAGEVESLRAELEELRAKADNTEEVDGLNIEIAALKAELANSERLDELKSELNMLRAERVSQADVTTQLDKDLQRLRKANDLLREANAALREANEVGVGEPSLINQAMLAELEALRASRATDAAEAKAILSRLEPLLAQADLAEGEDE
jgi:DNA repair exonuclease SbcCD ATPase subunit